MSRKASEANKVAGNKPWLPKAGEVVEFKTEGYGLERGEVIGVEKDELLGDLIKIATPELDGRMSYSVVAQKALLAPVTTAPVPVEEKEPLPVEQRDIRDPERQAATLHHLSKTVKV